MRSSKRSPRCGRKVLLVRGRKLRRQSLSSSNNNNNSSVAGSVSVTTSVERKLEQLLKILPSACAEINMETLFQMTADYIFLLEAKVSLLRNLSTFYGV